MNPAAYLEMAETESRHWWFLGRREILGSVMRELRLPANAEILEIGCGTGGNLELLSEFGEVSAVEMDSTARDIALGKASRVREIQLGKCPDDLPFAGRQFDLVCMFDVLEHIEDDEATLRAVRQLLKPGGILLLTVPAHQWLWSKHDEHLHHKRRYSGEELRRKVSEAGLGIDKLCHFNCFLFPLAVAARLKDRLLPSERSSGTAVPPAPVNALFHRTFASERHFLRHGGLPFGVSLLGIFRHGHG